MAPVEGLGWSIVGLGVDPDVPNPMPDKPGQGVGQQGAPHADPLVVRVDGQTLDEPVSDRATGQSEADRPTVASYQPTSVHVGGVTGLGERRSVESPDIG